MPASRAADRHPSLAPSPGGSSTTHSSTLHGGITVMSEEAQHARQALQESMDLREQGHTDD